MGRCLFFFLLHVTGAYHVEGNLVESEELDGSDEFFVLPRLGALLVFLTPDQANDSEKGKRTERKRMAVNVKTNASDGKERSSGTVPFELFQVLASDCHPDLDTSDQVVVDGQEPEILAMRRGAHAFGGEVA